ncbi:MAG: hypothetical protein WAN87_05985 [Thermoplasmata archaeon]
MIDARFSAPLGVVISLVVVFGGSVLSPVFGERVGPSANTADGRSVVDSPQNNSAVGNFSASINRLVLLLGAAGSGLLALVWARVALSWFSNDVTKKIQAKDRARDALIGTLLFTAAITGLAWGLAHWVLTGS